MTTTADLVIRNGTVVSHDGMIAASIAINMARAKNTPATYFVILVSALPEPAPNSASAAPPPNASPAPASFFGS